MSPASASGTATTTMPARTICSRNLKEASSSPSAPVGQTPSPKSDIQVHITNHYKTKIYTTGSPLSGSVTITSQREVRFDSVEIIFLGGSKTRTEGYGTPHESTHTFLKLIMPVPDSLYPVSRVLEPGTTITIPFNFVLPTFLTLSACHHKIDTEHVREQHLRLPPSMGAWSRGNSGKDDLAPHMAEVLYSIKARVWRQPDVRGRPIKVMEAVKPIQVIPASTEDAPLPIGPADTLYKMSKAKSLRRNILSSKLGTLTVSAPQPRAFTVRPDGRAEASSKVQLDLHFAPLAGAAEHTRRPPRVAAVSAKLIAHTFYSSGPVPSLPNTGGNFVQGGIAERRGEYTTSVTLPTMPTTSAKDGGIQQPVWATQRLSQRDSGYGSDMATGSDDEPHEKQARARPEPSWRRRSSLANLIRPSRTSPSLSAGDTTSSVIKAHTTTSLFVPLTLPMARRTFLPSFHSCILSRVYTLHVVLTVEAPGAGAGPATKVALDLPVQIVVGGEAGWKGRQAAEVLPSWAEAVEEAAAVDAFLRPRVLGVVPGCRAAEGGGEALARGALPGYERRA